METLSIGKLDDIYELLNTSYKDAKDTMSLFEGEDTITPSPEKRQLLSVVMDRMGGYVLEVSHVDSFLQSCEIQTLTSAQETTILQCQHLCRSLKKESQTVFKWASDAKAEFNKMGHAIPEDNAFENALNEGQEHHESSEETEGVIDVTPYDAEQITPAMIAEYANTRDILKELHTDMIMIDTEAMFKTEGRRLEAMEGQKLFIETEHEMNVFVDYGMFQYRVNGKNIVERYFDLNASLYSGDKLTILTALNTAAFSLFDIIKPVGNDGAIVYDAILDKQFLMMDKGLCKAAKTGRDYCLLTHYITLPHFILTTGASTPIISNSAAAKKMKSIFNDLAEQQQRKPSPDKQYYQCITDLYKTVIHDDVAKSISSRGLPMKHV